MQPEIVRDAPGTCPICGIALAPRPISGGRRCSWRCSIGRILPPVASAGPEHRDVAARCEETDVQLIAKVLWMRSRLHRHETWSPDELRVHQESAFAMLREHALKHSRFYRIR